MNSKPAGLAEPAQAAYWLLAGLIASIPPLAVIAGHAMAWIPLLPAIGILAFRDRLTQLRLRECDIILMFAVSVFFGYAMIRASVMDRKLFAGWVVTAASMVVLGSAIVRIVAAQVAARGQDAALARFVLSYLATLVLLFLVLQFDFTQTQWMQNKYRYAYAFNRPIVILMLLSPALLFAASHHVHRDGQPLAIISAFTLLGCLAFASSSETAKLVAILLPVIWIVTLRRPVAAAVLTVAGFCGALLAAPFVIEPLSRLIDVKAFGIQAGSSIETRIQIWVSLSARLAESGNWLFGFGPQAVRLLPADVLGTQVLTTTQGTHGHSLVFQTWFDLGLVGVLFLAAVVVAAVNVALAANGPTLKAVYLTWIAVLLIVGSVSHGMWQAWWIGAAGLVPSIIRLSSRWDAMCRQAAG
jgi:O-antigen ligase